MFDFISTLLMGAFLVSIVAVVALMIGAIALLVHGHIQQARSEKVFAPIASLLGMFILMFGVAGFPWIAARALPETQFGVIVGLSAWLVIMFVGAALMLSEEEMTNAQKKRKDAKKRHPSYKINY